jgi:hypothetical protein
VLVIRALATAALAAFAVIAASCTDDPSAQYFASKPSAPNQSPGIDPTTSSNSNAGALASRLLHGAIARPDPKLTPGVVAVSDLTTVCHGSKRIRGLFTPSSPLVAQSDQQAVFAAYNIPAASTKHYGLDFLVPLQLGGANTVANIWPASVSHGIGFREKQVLNIRIHELVCRREIPLDQAQRQISTDWVKLWLLYG